MKHQEFHELGRHVVDLVRAGRGDEAQAHLRELLVGVCGEGRPLSARVLDIDDSAIAAACIDDLESVIAEEEQSRGTRICAVCFDLTEPMGEDWYLEEDYVPAAPVTIGVRLLTDGRFPFSTSPMASLRDAYRGEGPPWEAGSRAQEAATVYVDGLPMLCGSLASLKGDIVDGRTLDGDSLVAYFVGSIYLSVLVYLALRRALPGFAFLRGRALLFGADEDIAGIRLPIAAAL